MRVIHEVKILDRSVVGGKTVEVTLGIAGWEWVVDDNKLLDTIDAFGDEKFFVTFKLTGSGTIDFRFVPDTKDLSKDKGYQRLVARESLKFGNADRKATNSPTEDEIDAEVERLAKAKSQAKNDEKKAKTAADAEEELSTQVRSDNTVSPHPNDELKIQQDKNKLLKSTATRNKVKK